MLALSTRLSVAHADPPRPCVDAKLKEHIRELSLQAVDTWMVGYVSKLIDTWLKDYNSGQLARSQVGMANGIEAYQHAHADALNWNPPVCKEQSP